MSHLKVTANYVAIKARGITSNRCLATLRSRGKRPLQNLEIPHQIHNRTPGIYVGVFLCAPRRNYAHNSFIKIFYSV